jgi:DNA-binding MarR family transcriptional regulator
LQGIRSLIATLTQSARAVEQRTGITNAQLFLLRELAADDALTINELAARALTGQNTVSAVVTRLEERGLVSRGRSASDGRVVTVTLTAAGRRLLQRAPEPPTGRLLRILSSLPPSDLRTVVRALTILNDGLGVAGVESEMLFEGDGSNLLAGRGPNDTPARRPGATTKRSRTVGDPALGKRRH